MVAGLVKLVYPDGVFTKDQLEEILNLALEMRRRVKEQLKKLGGMEFYDVNFPIFIRLLSKNIMFLSRNRAVANLSPRGCATQVKSTQFRRAGLA